MKIEANGKLLKHGVLVLYPIPEDMPIVQNFFDKYQGKLRVEIKRWKPLRTKIQNNFFHLLCSYIAKKLDMHGEAGLNLVKKGIEEKYGMQVMMFGKLIPKPSHLCNRFEEMNALIEGCFLEAGEAGIDMTDFIKQWEEIKRKRRL